MSGVLLWIPIGYSAAIIACAVAPVTVASEHHHSTKGGSKVLQLAVVTAILRETGLRNMDVHNGLSFTFIESLHSLDVK